MSFKGWLKQLGIRQNSKAELVAFRVDVSDVSAVTTGTGGLDEGSNYATILKTATGKYTITLNRTCRRIPVVVGAVAVGEDFVRLTSEPTTSQVLVTIEADDGTDTDVDFHLTLLCFYSATEH